MMDLEECYKIHAIAKEQVGDRKVWLLAGTSSVDTRQAVLVVKHAKKIGYDGNMLLAPPFVLPSERELINHYREVDKVGLPCMLYNNPERGKDQENLKLHIVEKLLELETAVALKDCTVNLPQLLETQKRCGDRIANFLGREPVRPGADAARRRRLYRHDHERGRLSLPRVLLSFVGETLGPGVGGPDNHRRGLPHHPRQCGCGRRQRLRRLDDGQGVHAHSRSQWRIHAPSLSSH